MLASLAMFQMHCQGVQNASKVYEVFFTNNSALKSPREDVSVNLIQVYCLRRKFEV